MHGKPRLLILGLDGAAYDLMKGWMNSGHLPTFAAFASNAVVAPLRCTWPPHTATGWTSLFTGRLPGEHGIFQFWDCQDPDYRLRVTPREATRCPTLWDVLVGQGWTLGLLNIPMSHPPGPWPGYQLTWPLVPTLRYSKPPELLHELTSVGGHALPDIACMYNGSPDYPELAKNYIRARTRSVQHLITNRPTDVVAVVYPEIDRVCHHYWHALDDSHPEYGRASLQEKSVIADIFAAIDTAFAELLSLVSDDCVVMVVSDHGFGPGRRGLRLHQVLAQAGFCVLKARPSRMPVDQPDNHMGDVADYLGAMDWENTDIYMPTPGCFGVNLNLKGRQTSGTVKVDDQMAIASSVTEYLLGLADPDTGGAIFEAVLPAAMAYAGSYSAHAPDLLLVPIDPALMLLHDVNGPVWDVSGQTGLHRLEGIWMVRASNMSAQESREPIAIEAVAGQLLTTLGVTSNAIPRFDENRPASSALIAAGLPHGAWSVIRDVATCWPARSSTVADIVPTILRSGSPPLESAPEAESEVIERLRAMGYI